MKVISPTMSVIHGSTLSVMSNYVHSQVKGKKMAKIKYNYTNYVHSPKSRPFHHKSNSRLYPFNTTS